MKLQIINQEEVIMIHLGKDVKLNVCPILVTLHHDYVFEGPAAWEGLQLTKEFDDMANARDSSSAHEGAGRESHQSAFQRYGAHLD